MISSKTPLKLISHLIILNVRFRFSFRTSHISIWALDRLHGPICNLQELPLIDSR